MEEKEVEVEKPEFIPMSEQQRRRLNSTPNEMVAMWPLAVLGVFAVLFAVATLWHPYQAYRIKGALGQYAEEEELTMARIVVTPYGTQEAPESLNYDGSAVVEENYKGRSAVHFIYLKNDGGWKVIEDICLERTVQESGFFEYF